jgi:hypothetical protein
MAKTGEHNSAGASEISVACFARRIRSLYSSGRSADRSVRKATLRLDQAGAGRPGRRKAVGSFGFQRNARFARFFGRRSAETLSEAQIESATTDNRFGPVKNRVLKKLLALTQFRREYGRLIVRGIPASPKRTRY